MRKLRPRTRGAAAALLAVASLAGVLFPGHAPVMAAELSPRLHPRIVNGELTFAYPTTGALLMHDGSGETFAGLCSGTLIGCRTFLTAAHCVCPAGAYSAESCLRRGLADPSSFHVFLPHGGMFPVAHVAISPDYSFAEGGDVAILSLAQPVHGIAPAAINTVRRLSAGESPTAVGFGTTAASRRAPDEAGIKRRGSLSVTACPNDIPGDTHLCWNFDGSASNTCDGDSGGPQYVDLGSGQMLAGITSGGSSFDCLAPDTGFSTDVFVHRDWILATAADDLGLSSCELPDLSDSSVAVLTAAAEISAAQPEATLEIEVPLNTAVLRVGLNGQIGSATSIDRSNEFDLYIRGAASPTASSFDCADTVSGPFGFCTIESPAAGTWHVLVRRQQGDGLFQLTATMFAETECAGDCDRDRSVTVDEILTGVRILFGSEDISTCPACDRNQDGNITIDEVLAAVGSALNGCAPA